MPFKAKSLFFLYLFILYISVALPEENPTELEELPQEIAYGVKKLRYKLGDRLSNLIFDAIDSISIYTFQTSNNSSIGLKIGRNVYNNHDILQSWTVTDTVKIPISIPIYSKAFDLLDSLPLSFSIGVNGNLDLINIRQVKSKKYSSLPSIKDRLSEIENSFNENVDEFNDNEDNFVINFDENESNSPDDSLGLNKKYKEIFINDSLNNARYSNYLNIISAPLRLPLSANLIKKLDIGEISAYKVGGAFICSLSWIPEPLNFVNPIKLGVSVSAYVRGDFRITIMRVSKTIARVKLTKSVSNGKGLTVGGSTNFKEHESIDGILFFDYISSNDFTITPFSINSNKENVSIFDVVYEYDLNHPEAIEAYNNAVWGNFKISGDLAKKYLDKDRNKIPVIEIGSLHTDGSGKNFNNRLRLGFIYKKNYSLSSNLQTTQVFLPDGNHQILKGVTQNHKEWKSIIGSYERITYDFTVNVFPEKISSSNDDWLSIVAEGKIEDSHTNGKELAFYINHVESSIGKQNIFKTPPVYLPVKKPSSSSQSQEGDSDENEYRLASYGRSNFIFRIKLSQAQIERFILKPEDEMWSILEKAFYVKEGIWSTPSKRLAYQTLRSGVSILNYPLYIVDLHIRAGSDLFYARQIYKEWKNLKNYINKENIYKALNDLFSQRRYSHELFRILIACQDDDEVAYMVRGANDAIGGVIWDQNSETLSINPIIDKIDMAINFDRPENIVINDPNAIATDIKMEKITSTNYWQLSFNLSKKPQYLFLQLHTQHFIYEKPILELVVHNKTTFEEGPNSFTLDQNAPAFLKKLASLIEPNKQYILSIGVSNNGKQWGSLSKSKFHTIRK